MYKSCAVQFWLYEFTPFISLMAFVGLDLVRVRLETVKTATSQPQMRPAGLFVLGYDDECSLFCCWWAGQTRLATPSTKKPTLLSCVYAKKNTSRNVQNTKSSQKSNKKWLTIIVGDWNLERFCKDLTDKCFLQWENKCSELLLLLPLVWLSVRLLVSLQSVCWRIYLSVCLIIPSLQKDISFHLRETRFRHSKQHWTNQEAFDQQ